jgi:hypothetical protein
MQLGTGTFQRKGPLMAEGPPRTFFWQVVWSVMAISNVVRWPLAIIVHIGGTVALFWDGLILWAVLWIFIVGPIAAVLVTLIVAIPFFIGGLILACLLVPARWLWTRERAAIPIGTRSRAPMEMRTEAVIVEEWNEEARTLALDQPAGTRASTATSISDTLESKLEEVHDRMSTLSPTHERLHDAIMQGSAAAADSLLASWSEMAGKSGVSVEENRLLRTEMTWYMLHMADRTAFGRGGPANRDKICPR